MAKFKTTIDATGSNGNIFAVLGAARIMMRQLDVPKEDLTALGAKVMAASSYKEAIDAIREWFPVDTGDGGA